jgi:pteridine reductase
MAHPKVALVTGSGRRRIGWHVADALGRRGYAIALHYHRSAREADESAADFVARGVPAAAFGADLADEAAARGLVEAVRAKWGRLDVLVNCASAYQSKPLEEITAADVRLHFEANVLSTFLCSRAAGLVMVGQPEGGNIVTFGDWAEARPYLDFAAYFATKGGIPTLTRCLAVELGTRNPRVRVNCVLPGPVLLPPDLPEPERHAAIAGTLVQQEGGPESAAQAVLSLIENDFITGTCLTVDGGRSVYARGG